MRSQSFRLLLAVLAMVALAFLPSCAKYDQLVTYNSNCDAAWADIQVQLQRRADLVPNLVAAVKGSAAHEEKTLKEVSDARAAATSINLSADDLSDPVKMAAFQKAQDNLKGSLSRLLAVQEAYPDLKANAAFQGLQVQLEGTENRIARSREQYNDAVRQYNTELAKLGGKAVNQVTGKSFLPRAFFNADASAQTAPVVSF
ncbi:MAG: LemA family protein [Polyangiaceae bacterium]